MQRALLRRLSALCALTLAPAFLSTCGSSSTGPAVQLTVTVTPNVTNALPGQTVVGTIQVTTNTSATIDSVGVVATGIVASHQTFVDGHRHIYDHAAVRGTLERRHRVAHHYGHGPRRKLGRHGPGRHRRFGYDASRHHARYRAPTDDLRARRLPCPHGDGHRPGRSHVCGGESVGSVFGGRFIGCARCAIVRACDPPEGA